MKQKFNLDREFIKWFYEEPYPDETSNRATVQGHSYGMTPNVETRDYWMREAYKQGARVMAQEVLDILADWAAQVEGLDPEMVEPCEIYDRARASLFTYTTKVLDTE